LIKIEPEPLRILRFSGTESLPYNKIDASQFNRVAAFSKDLQVIRYFDRNLNFLSEISFRSGIGIIPANMSVSSDNKIWIYDETANSVLKFDPFDRQIILNLNCNSFISSESSVIIDIKEYQNRLYLLDKQKQVYLFDNMGNFIRKSDYVNPDFLSFYDNYIVSRADNVIKLFNLYDSSVKEINMPGSESFTSIFISGKYLITAGHNITFKRLETVAIEK
jgi:hypothetical protein